MAHAYVPPCTAPSLPPCTRRLHALAHAQVRTAVYCLRVPPHSASTSPLSRSLPPFLQAAAGAAPAAAAVTQQPEFLLPYLLYLLGHHPDMPQVRGGGGLETERYAEDGGGLGGLSECLSEGPSRPPPCPRHAG